MTKVSQPKKKEAAFSEFSNLNPNAPAATQTVSNKTLIRGLLHGIGYRVKLGNPVTTLDSNIDLHVKALQKANVNPEVITMLKLQIK